jgi:hypothetical protein
MTCLKQKDRLAAVSPKSDQVFFDQVAAEFSRFLRQPSRPNRPRPVAKSGRAAGSRVTDIQRLSDINNFPTRIRYLAAPRRIIRKRRP